MGSVLLKSHFASCFLIWWAICGPLRLPTPVAKGGTSLYVPMAYLMVAFYSHTLNFLNCKGAVEEVAKNWKQNFGDLNLSSGAS